MRISSAAVAVVLVTLSSACGGGEEAPEPTSAPPEATSPPDAPTAPLEGGGQVLTGTVGEEGQPDAFVITLTDGSGAEVTNLPAGEYDIEVDDLSAIHNFHLTGPGGVDEKTTVSETGSVTWTVSLEPGEYTYVCDPHSQNMVGTLTVS